jgi:hypothetical protein
MARGHARHRALRVGMVDDEVDAARLQRGEHGGVEGRAQAFGDVVIVLRGPEQVDGLRDLGRLARLHVEDDVREPARPQAR